jgi:hypothetical protein
MKQTNKPRASSGGSQEQQRGVAQQRVGANVATDPVASLAANTNIA